MKVIIIEDEQSLAEQLESMLSQVAPVYEVVGRAHSIKKAIEVIEDTPIVDLIFLDIYLSDGLSFDIFHKVDRHIPVIFTTAFDQHAIEAFDLNSIDYLLKPIRVEKLKKAIEKFERLAYASGGRDFSSRISKLSEALINQKRYKENFLLSYKDRLIPVHVNDFCYFMVTNSVVKGVTKENRLFIMDDSLDELADRLDPSIFFRANRQFLIHRGCIQEIESYFNGRLSLNLLPRAPELVLVSKAKSGEFKQWMNDDIR